MLLPIRGDSGKPSKPELTQYCIDTVLFIYLLVLRPVLQHSTLCLLEMYRHQYHTIHLYQIFWRIIALLSGFGITGSSY